MSKCFRPILMILFVMLLASMLLGAAPLALAQPATPVDFTGDVTGKQAAAFEGLLIDWGFQPFAADGTWTDRDAYALALFQHWAGLTPTGLPDSATRAALQQTWGKYGDQRIPRQRLPLEGRAIGVNAGHQSGKDKTYEQVSPDAGSPWKYSVSIGTCGRWTKVPEYKLTLVVALQLRDALQDQGAYVYMVRTTNDVRIGNAKRAQMMNDAGVDLGIVIHADGNNSASVHGLHVLQPGARGYQRGTVLAQSQRFAKLMLQDELAATGSKGRGMSTRKDLLSFNWAKMPICLVEMGFMTNKTEDKLMQTAAYQKKIVAGMVQAVKAYYQTKK